MKPGFVYCWTDAKDGMLYVGVHKGFTEDGYVCSSKWMLEEYHKRPLDFSRQIIAEGDYEDMRALEMSILKSIDSKRDPKMYNMHNGSGNFYLKSHTEESKRKISLANVGRSREDLSKRNMQGHSKETRKKISANHADVSGIKNPMFGKSHAADTKDKISKARKKLWDSSEGKKRYSKNFGKRELIECPHCEKIGGANAMKRWHFDNCKVLKNGN